MKRLLPILIAGAMVSAALYATDQNADERFRIKYGRYSQAAEARNQARARAAREEIPLCCRSASITRTAVEERLEAKLGRTTPAEEIRERKAAEESTARAEKCLGLGTCTRMGENALQTENAAPTQSPEVKERMSEKYGRSFEVATAPGSNAEPCEHDCCKRATN